MQTHAIKLWMKREMYRKFCVHQPQTDNISWDIEAVWIGAGNGRYTEEDGVFYPHGFQPGDLKTPYTQRVYPEGDYIPEGDTPRFPCNLQMSFTIVHVARSCKNRYMDR